MIEIRKSFSTDAYNLIQVYDKVWKSEYYDVLPNGIMNEMIRHHGSRVSHLKDQIMENNRIFVALDDDKIVGFIFYAKSQSSVYISSAEIREIYVLPEYQRQGIGKKLFVAAVDALKKLGFHSLIVYCPSLGSSYFFFDKMGGEKKESMMKEYFGYLVSCDIIYFDLDEKSGINNSVNDWNLLYQKAQDHLFLLNDINQEIAVIMTESGNFYLGIRVKNKICPIESAISNMYLNQDKRIVKILILNKESKPVLPCGKCRDLLIELGHESALILFDFGELKTMTMKELNPYYKDEEVL